MKKELGRRFRFLRKQQNLSQNRMAKKLGYNQGHISQVEPGGKGAFAVHIMGSVGTR